MLGTPVYYASAMDLIDLRSMTLGVILGVGIYKLWDLYNEESEKDNSEENDHRSFDCYFFTPKKSECTFECMNKENIFQEVCSIPCNGCNLNNIFSVLAKAKKHLDICMYLITSQDICNVILEAFKNGVHVRIIMDKQMSEDAFGHKVLLFRKKYVPIKIMKSNCMMHNKFAVVDQELVVTGSVNWTKQGFTGNYENVLVMTNSDIARKYINYFELLWNMKE